LSACLILISMFSCSSAQLFSGDVVVVDRTKAAYTIYAVMPKDKLDALKAKLANRPSQKVVLVSWKTFIQNTDKYVKTRIIKNEYPESKAAAGVVELIRKYKGSPFGLTWNGGIAITYNDYRHARRIYKKYKANPAEYDRTRNRNPRADPINPKWHLGPLLGW